MFNHVCPMTANPGMAGGNRQFARGGCGQASVMATRPTAYYDGGCPVCAREINLYRGGKAAGSSD